MDRFECSGLAEKPGASPDGNWPPTPKSAKYRLTFRYCGRLDGVSNGAYHSPPLMKVR
jgi:hypothetical protein